MNRLESSSLYQLTSTRFRLFLREPEAIFWVFIFPILLAVGLGIAFRNRPADVLPVAATTTELTRALATEKGLSATTMDEASGRHALAIGTINLLAIQRGDDVAYQYDQTNPDARTARLLAERAVQRAAGRRDAVATQDLLVHETGARYIDFVVPGLLGMNLMGSAIWGMGFAIVEARQKKLLKRMVASPMPRWQYMASFILSRLAMLVIEVVVFVGFARLAFGVPLARISARPGSHLSDYFAGFLRIRLAGCLESQDHGSRVRLDEPGDAADVDSVGSLLFGFAFSLSDPTFRTRAPAHCGHRCAAQQHAPGNQPCPPDDARVHFAGVAGCAVRGYSKDIPMAVSRFGPSRRIDFVRGELVGEAKIVCLLLNARGRTFLGIETAFASAESRSCLNR